MGHGRRFPGHFQLGKEELRAPHQHRIDKALWALAAVGGVVIEPARAFGQPAEGLLKMLFTMEASRLGRRLATPIGTVRLRPLATDGARGRVRRTGTGAHAAAQAGQVTRAGSHVATAASAEPQTTALAANMARVR